MEDKKKGEQPESGTPQKEWDYLLIWQCVRLGGCLGLMFLYGSLGRFVELFRNGKAAERLALVFIAVFTSAVVTAGLCFLNDRYRKSRYYFYCRCQGRHLYPLLAAFMERIYPGTEIFQENGIYSTYFILHIPDGKNTGLKMLCCLPHSHKPCFFRIRRIRHIMDEGLQHLYETGADTGVVIMEDRLYHAYRAAAFFRRAISSGLEASRRKDAVHK